MSDCLIAFLFIYGLTVLGVAIVSALHLDTGHNFLFDTPRDLYDKTNMNWFGCIFVWFLEFLLNPIAWIFAIIIWFFNWLFTVGRD